MKKKGLSDVGQMLVQAKDGFDLAFDKIKDLILEASGLPPFKNDTGVLLYRKLVMGTIKQGKKDREVQKDQIKTHVRPYKAMFEAFKDRIVEEDLTWMVESDVNIQTGASKKACLPLSKVYEYCLKKDESKLDSLEAHLYFLFKYVCDEKTQSEHRKKLDAICSEYQIEEDDSAKRAVSSIVNRVKTRMPTGTDGKEPNVNDVTSIVQAIVGDGSMQSDMGGLAQGLLSGKLTIPDLIGQVKQTIEASQSAQSDAGENDEDGDSDEDESDEDEGVTVIKTNDKGKEEL